MDRIAKAIVAALAGFIVLFDMATSDGSVAGEAIVNNEWVRIVAGSVVAGLSVWAVPNTPAPPTA